MNRKQHICFVLVFLFISFKLVGQVENSNVLELPEAYLTPITSDFDNSYLAKTVRGRAWKVYSDRNNNTSYKKANKRSAILSSRIQFMDEFYVIEYKKGFLHIAKDSKLNEHLILSSASVDYGWIPVSNLLLSRHCIITPKSKINVKVFILKLQKSLHGYTNLNNDFFYLFKNTDSSLLIGRLNRLVAGEDKKKIILGWISKDDALVWDNRLAFEPNYSTNPIIFLNKNDAYNFSIGKPYLKENNYDIINQFNDTSSMLGRKLPFLWENKHLVSVAIINQSNKTAALGFIPKNQNNLNNSMFERYIMVSRLELGQLIQDFSLIIRLAKKHQVTGYFDAIKELLQRHWGGAYLKELNNETLYTTLENTWGYPINNKYLETINLNNIGEEDVFSQIEFQNHLLSIDVSLNYLLRWIFNNDNYPQKFFSEVEVYYWIPVNYLP